ncbi:RICIN domain-containing protein [Streptomyces cucumeris]|uniref:RICIN domain-containing protein n=1 Tax=Streptomyces cucumeris TaxID=2962890 RepID=UPI003D722466
MSDQHQAGGAETPSGSQAAGAASPDPEAAPARGSSPSEASASGPGSAATPDAASVEAHLTGRVPSATGGSGTTSTSSTSSTSSPAGAKGSKGASGEEGSSTGEGSSEATKKAPAAKGSSEAEAGEGGEASEPEGADGESTGTAETASETEEGSGTPETAASEGASATGTRSGGKTRAGRSGRGRGAIATVSGEARAEGPAAAATASAAAPGGSGPDAAAGFPGRPKKPLLAGAAMAGAVLVAVPLLVMAVSDKDEKSEKVATAGSSDTVLDDDGSRAGAFVPESPSPKKEKPKKEKKEKAPAAAKQPPPAAPSSPTAKPKAKPRSPAKKKASSLPLLNNVLIKNNTNQTCADIPGTGYQDGPVHQSACNSTMQDNQLWDVEKKYGKAGPGGAPLYQIRNVVDNLCMDLPGYGGASGASYVTEYPCNGTTDDNQLWWLDKQSDGRYWIRNFASNNQCLDSYEADSETRNLIIWPCNEESQNNHEWYFTAH